MRTILSTQRKVLRYGSDLLAGLPIRFLLQTAERDQAKFGVLFPQLLRLSSTQYPHLCLVQDWLADDDDDSKKLSAATVGKRKTFSEAETKEAFASMDSCTSKLTLVMQSLLTLSPSELWKYSDIIVGHIKNVLKEGTPRQIAGKVLEFFYGV